MGLTEIDPSASSTNGLAAPFALELGRSDCRRCTGVRVLGNHCGLVNLVMTILLHLQRLTVTGSRRDRGGWRLVARTMAPAVAASARGQDSPPAVRSGRTRQVGQRLCYAPMGAQADAPATASASSL